MWRGLYQPVLTLLSTPPERPDDRGSIIEILALEGAAHARLHEFLEAEEKLGEAAQLCQLSSAATCGDVMRARGVLAVQHGQTAEAQQFFAQSVEFARANNDRLLEATGLLNLGLTSLQEEHFDEAIDWTEAAYEASTALGADYIAQTALGNLGSAYYNLGDSERSLELSVDAEKRATAVGAVIDQLSWITNAGYVYASVGDFARAKQSYLKALDLATTIKGTEDKYNALRALALVSVENGELDEARSYSDQAIAIARTDRNRRDELYPLFVRGLIASKKGDWQEAEGIFREVEMDKKGGASLKWRAENGLARLYEDEKRPAPAAQEYRAALATFEVARSSLKRNDVRLPFSSNGSGIYDDYVHFLVSNERVEEALRWADYSRARTLAEGLGSLSEGVSPGPPSLSAKEIAKRSGTVLFYWLGARNSGLWVITPQKVTWIALRTTSEIEAAVERYRKALDGPQDVLDSGNEDGRNLYNWLIAPAQELIPKGAKVVVIPDGKLNNLNFETLVVSAPKPHYWIDDVTVVNASSLRVLATPRSREGKRTHNLLLIGNAVSPSHEYAQLTNAAVEMTSIAKHFPASEQRVFQLKEATPAAYLAGNPELFSYIHFVAHGTANRLRPLDSAIVLSPSNGESESFKLYARDIIQHRVRAELVTISSCRGAGTRAYSGEGLVGLSWAFLGAGAHHVIAALWDASDVSTAQLMDRFYDGLDKDESPEVALRSAKLTLLHSQSAFHRPFYWAPFQLYAGS